MATLLRARAALRKAHQALPDREAITDLAYLVDVDPYGAESLVVYITTVDARSLDAASKRTVETKLREALSRALGCNVYFRWQTNNEVMQGQQIVTEAGLVDQPHSALH
jgi:hypothetical protein